MKLIQTVLADTVESELMRGHSEAFVGEFGRRDLSLVIDHHVEDPIAALANEMLVASNQRIEMLRSAEHQHLQFLIGHEFLQIAVDGAETDAGQFFPHSIVDLIGGGMRRVVFDSVPNQFELLGISRWTAQLGHN
jgi:hypothetical protein